MENEKLRRVLVAAFLAIAFGMAVAPVHAFTPGACRQDADKLCPGMNDKDQVACLKLHEVDISTACKVNLAEAREHVRQMHEECDQDKKNFCADVQPGKGRILKCLKAHEAELSTACRDKIADAKRKLLPGTTEQLKP